MKKYISDQIDKQEISKWTPEQPVVITAGTGSGKSYFILNTLLKHAEENNERILLLVPRIAIKEQFLNSLGVSSSGILIETYQWLEGLSLREKSDLAFDYVVADEAHYFVQEASFNKNTVYSWNWINECQAVKIYLSATPDKLLKIMSSNHMHYDFRETPSYIESVRFFRTPPEDKYSYIREQLNHFLQTGEKAVVFVSSILEGADLFKEFESHSLFLCSSSQKHFSKLVDERSKKPLIENEYMVKQFLITTSFLEYGVTIKDSSLKHIFFDGFYADSMAQSLGRKRSINANDNIVAHIAIPDGRAINGRIQDLKRKIKPLLEVLEGNDSDILHTLYSDSTSISGDEYRGIALRYDDKDNVTVDINPLAVVDYQCSLEELQELQSKIKNESYYPNVSESLGTEEWYLAEELEKTNQLNTLFEELTNVRLYDKEDRDMIINAIDLKKNYRQVRSIKALNEHLEQLKVGYTIFSRQDKSKTLVQDNETIKNHNYNKTYWIIKNVNKGDLS